MLFAPGPCTPIDEDAFRRLVAPDEPGALASALSPLVAELYAHAGALDVAHDQFAEAGQAPADDADGDTLLQVLVDSGAIVDDPDLALDPNVAGALGSGDTDIDTLTRELAGEAPLSSGSPSTPATSTQEDIDAAVGDQPDEPPLEQTEEPV